MIKSQTLIPLTGGAYQSRNAIGDYEVAENVFMELNPQETDAPAPATHYPREGISALSSPPTAGKGRGVFTLSNGNLIAVVGPNVYFITQTWQFNLLGTIGLQSTPVAIDDNGTTAILVDGTPNGYQIPITAPNTLSALTDPTGTFMGSVNVSFSDTYLSFATPGTTDWNVTNPNSIVFNALQQASKDSKPDPIVVHIFNIRQAWLIGSRESEVWFLAGSTPFPYQAWPNVQVPYGCVAPYSLVQADIDLFWLSRNKQGQAIAVQTRGSSVEAISTRALEYEWSGYQNVSDCIGGTYQVAGHTFVIFHFPTADKSWGYDLSTKQWHRRTYIDQNGTSHREKVSFYASVGADAGYPKTIVGQDWQNGTLYAVSPQTYSDAGQPIVCRRSFPHQLADLREVTFSAFVADFATGNAPNLSEAGTPFSNSDWNGDFNLDFGGAVITTPALCMRYSKDGGKTWSNFRQKTLITSGHYRSMMRWRGLGMGRDWVFELLWVYPGPTALQGAYVDAVMHGS